MNLAEDQETLDELTRVHKFLLDALCDNEQNEAEEAVAKAYWVFEEIEKRIRRDILTRLFAQAAYNLRIDAAGVIARTKIAMGEKF